MADSDRERALSDALKAQAYDLERLASEHAASLRGTGNEELAERIEELARNARTAAEEHDASS